MLLPRVSVIIIDVVEIEVEGDKLIGAGVLEDRLQRDADFEQVTARSFLRFARSSGRGVAFREIRTYGNPCSEVLAEKKNHSVGFAPPVGEAVVADINGEVDEVIVPHTSGADLTVPPGVVANVLTALYHLKFSSGVMCEGVLGHKYPARGPLLPL